LKQFFAAIIISSLTLTFADPARAADQQTDTHKKLAEIFVNADATGTFVLFDLTANRFTYHDKHRAETRFIPASTFKIPNSLIGLSTGAVSSVDEVLPYGGEPQSFKSWEQDMGLREAIKISNVPVYRELARRIGLERMQENISRIDYGNNEIGAVVDLFWLNGPLKISAVEQSRFLARLAKGELNFPAETQQAVRDIITLDQGQNWVLYGKTGWEVKSVMHIGWWVGWVVNDGNIYSFALNIDMPNLADAGKRVEIGKDALRLFGLIE
jgi:beta-lactamase class D